MRHRVPGGIAARLMVAMAVVFISAALAAWLVAGAVGPRLFRRHMAEAETSPGTAVEHAETAFASASTVTLAVALLAAVATALVVSTILARRIGASLVSLSSAAAHVAAGRFDVRLAQPHIGSEFDNLVDAFNAMATRLDHDEMLRRRLMADVAHELRTPVATLSAYVDALEDGVEDLTPQTVAVLQAQTARLARLAADLAAVTKAEGSGLRLDLQFVAAADLVEGAVAAARPRAEEAGVTLTAAIEPGLPMLRIDPDRMGQVLGNLLDNAIRHTPRGGRITISVRRVGSSVRLTVEDTGEGISAEHLPHVFDRFYRVDTARDRAHGGSGIGLTIAKALVQAHGGTISAHSAGPGLGTQFWVDLPV